jgi:hypothetical protein
MSEFETPFFRDLSKFILPICLGVMLGMVCLLLFFPIMMEINFNIDGIESGFNILTERYGSCFVQENHQLCSSGAWSVSIIWIVIGILGGLSIAWLRLKIQNKESVSK